MKRARSIMKVAHLAFPMLILLGASPVFAKPPQLGQAEALAQIETTANALCVEAQTTGSGHQAKVNGEIDAKLLALLKKLGQVEGSLAADYSHDGFVGVLREQVLSSITATNACKMHVFDKLVDKLLPEGSARTEPVIQNPPSPRLSPQDAYLIATHPTKVALKEMRFMRFMDDGATNFLSVVLKNESEIPAHNVLVDWVQEKKGEPLTRAKVISVKQSNYTKALGTAGITVAAQSDSYFPIISVAELSSLILGKDSDYCVYDASPDPIDPEVSNAALLREQAKMGEDTQAWYSSTHQVGVRLRIKYKTIFEQVVTRYPLVFVHLVEKGSRGPIWYPGSQSVGPARCISA